MLTEASSLSLSGASLSLSLSWLAHTPLHAGHGRFAGGARAGGSRFAGNFALTTIMRMSVAPAAPAAATAASIS